MSHVAHVSFVIEILIAVDAETGRFYVKILSKRDDPIVPVGMG